jgi:hypothetical protein
MLRQKNTFNKTTEFTEKKLLISSNFLSCYQYVSLCARLEVPTVGCGKLHYSGLRKSCGDV